MRFVYDDGGRKAAGRKGDAGDCVTRAIAIATGLPYSDVYDAMAHGNATQRVGRRERRKTGRSGTRTASHGINTRRQWFKDYMTALGWKWTPTMQIGSGCKVHLTDGELPMGRLIVSISKHYTAVIDGVIRDTHDPQREPETWYWANGTQSTTGGRCVYGHWSKV